MPQSAYIHIPFCKSKCRYCSFVSFPCLEQIDDYIKALSYEIKSLYKNEVLKTLYFGGGTPSLLSVENIESLIKLFNIDDNSEITFELNPDDAELNYLKNLRGLGINRLSTGVQTFDNKILKDIGRRHSGENCIKAAELAKNAGFKNISADLIYGLPNQTIKTILDDLSIISGLEIQHISTYGLKIEQPSYFYKNKPENLPDEDFQADMYLLINEYLENNGFKRYEISNFAKSGYESKHNLNYWNNQEYYGFGVSAHGYINGVRYSNYSDLADYILKENKQECFNTLTTAEKLEEEIFLGFRKESGIDVKKINGMFNIDFEEKYKKVLSKYSDEYIKKTPEGFKLTLKGVLLSNIVLSEFMS